MEKEFLNFLEKNENEIYALGDDLFNCAELGYREKETARIICEFLDKKGIPYTKEHSQTGVVATIGEGGYHIALIADMDAVLVGAEGERIPFHSCGHSVQVSSMLGVLAAIHESRALEGTGVRLSFIATPAEEFIDLEYRNSLIEAGHIRYASGKQDMIANGLFDDVDCVFSIHITGTPDVKFDIGSTLAGFAIKKVVFHGEAAHSGAEAHLGKNALHAASLCLQACSYLTEQFPHEGGIQLHPILSEGGISMNVIPEKAVLETYIRANNNEYLFSACEKFDKAAEGCAQALGVDCEIKDTTGYMPLKQDKKLTSLLSGILREKHGEEDIAAGIVSGASGDIGDLSFLMPSIQMGFSGFSGRIHSNAFEITNKKLAYIDSGAAIMALVLKLAQEPEHRVYKEDYENKKAFYLKTWLHDN